MDLHARTRVNSNILHISFPVPIFFNIFSAPSLFVFHLDCRSSRRHFEKIRLEFSSFEPRNWRMHLSDSVPLMN